MNSAKGNAEYQQQVKRLQDNIQNYKEKLNLSRTHDANATQKNTDTMRAETEAEIVQNLLSEFEKLQNVHMERAQEYKNQFDNLQTIRKERKAKIKERQREFEQDLLPKTKDDPAVARGKALATCNRLLELLAPLKNYDVETAPELVVDALSVQENGGGKDDRITVLNASKDTDIDTSVLVIPFKIMELFWAIEIEPPVCVSEVETTVSAILEKRETLEKNA